MIYGGTLDIDQRGDPVSLEAALGHARLTSGGEDRVAWTRAGQSARSLGNCLQAAPRSTGGAEHFCLTESC